MNTTSPQEAKIALPKLIEVNCPFCLADGRKGLLGKVLKKRRDVLVQNAIKTDSLDAIVDVIYYCRHCDMNFVYGVIVV